MASRYLFLLQHSPKDCANRHCSANTRQKHALVWSCLNALKWPLLSSAVPRLILIGFKYAQPFLLNRTIGFVNAAPSKQPDGIGWGLVGAYAVVYIGLAVS